MPTNAPSRWLPGTLLCSSLLLGVLPALASDDFLTQADTPDTLHQPLLDQTLTRLAPNADSRVMRLAARALSCAASFLQYSHYNQFHYISM